MVTDQQVALLRQRQMEGKKQQTAAAMAGMSERSARKWQCGPLPSERKWLEHQHRGPDPDIYARFARWSLLCSCWQDFPAAEENLRQSFRPRRRLRLKKLR